MQNGLRVLIVDDEPLFSEYLSDLLDTELKNVVVKISHDGFDAGLNLREFSPDIVLLDVMLPGFDGFRICKQIKQDPHFSQMRVIAMTGNKTVEMEKMLVSSGAEICFEKPIDIKQLIEQINLRSVN